MSEQLYAEQQRRREATNLNEAGVQVLACTEKEGLNRPAENFAELGWLDSTSSTWSERLAWEALHNYATFHLGYLASVILLGALVLVVGGNLSISAAIFTTIAALTQSGLSIINFAGASPLVHVTVFFVIILGSPLLLTLVPVLLRRLVFRSLVRWCRNTGRKEPSADEDGALMTLSQLVLGFWVAGEILGWLLLLPVDWTRVNGGPRVWTALFMATSAFQNTGLATTPHSLEPLAYSPYALYVLCALIILGNTGVPICLRALSVIAMRCTHEGSNTREHLAFLLKEPRRCYTHLFSPLNTLWLAVMLVVLLVVQIIIMACLDWGSPELEQFKDPQVRFANIVFQAVSTRTCGLNSIVLNRLSVPALYVIAVCMYISTSPVVVTMRATNVRHEGQGGNEISTFKSHAFTYFTQHGAILIMLLLAILMLEDGKMARASKPCDSMESCDLRARFSFFKIMFEVISAYGTVGYSLGSTYVKNSFCEDWTVPSQMLLCGVMLLGRTRDLPLSIDHAFKMHWEGSPNHAESNRETVRVSSRSYDGITELTPSGLPAALPGVEPLVAEFIGTFILVFTSVCNALSMTSSWWATTSIALMYVAFLYSFHAMSSSTVSSGYLNPVVSIALGLVGKMAWTTVLSYCVVQILGGVFAGFSCYLVYGITAPFSPQFSSWFWEGFIVETLYTAMLVFVVLNCACSKRSHPLEAPNQYYPLAIGFALIAGGYAARSISSSVFNPAVSIGIALTNATGLGWCFFHICCQLQGALLAILLFRQVRPEESSRHEHHTEIFEPRLPTKLASEFIGTFLLVLTVGLNVTGRSAATAWSAGAALAAMTYSLADVSGGHFNPAVTLAVMLSGRGKCPPQQGVCYIITQVLAGTCAAFLYAGIYHSAVPSVRSHKYGMFAALQMEFLFTFVLCLVFLSACSLVGSKTSSGKNFYFGLAIGLCLTAGGVACGSVSGVYLNPAVTLGSAFASTLNRGSFITARKYIAAEFCGGAIASAVFFVTHASEYPKSSYH